MIEKYTNEVNSYGILYVVSTPIGNLKDITLRALETLKQADIIACEDTRITKKLLSHYNIKNKFLISYGNHNLKVTTPKIISKLKEQLSVALVSDAGTPLISDPGYELVQECIKNNIKITTIPGASALISALTLSGINTTEFYFGSFLENKISLLTKQLLKAKNLQTNIVYFIAAHKLPKVIPYIINIFGTKQDIIIVREITKMFEEVIINNAVNLLNLVNKKNILGEVVLILPYQTTHNIQINKDELTNMLQDTLKNHNLKDSLNIIKNYYQKKGTKINKKELYNLGVLINNNNYAKK